MGLRKDKKGSAGPAKDKKGSAGTAKEKKGIAGTAAKSRARISVPGSRGKASRRNAADKSRSPPLLALLLVAVVLLLLALLLLPPTSSPPRSADSYEKIDDIDAINEINPVNADGTVEGANGGTELMLRGLQKRLPSIFKDYIEITPSRVRDVPRGKAHVLWLHDLPGDPESKRLFEGFGGGSKYRAIVFVSEWQRQKYLERYPSFFGSFPGAVQVLRNAIVPFSHQDVAAKLKKQKGPLRIIYHTTPHRGLELLLPAFDFLYKKFGHGEIEMDVYSSFALYNWPHRDEPYKSLFDSCRQHPACTYHGAVSNEAVREALKKSHIFAYPSIWEETSCLAAIEAMSAGCTVVTSSLGALPETAGGQPGMRVEENRNLWMNMYPHNEDKRKHLEMFFGVMNHTIATYWEAQPTARRRQTALFATGQYDWGEPGWSGEGRMAEWIQLLAKLMPDKFDSVQALEREYRKEGAKRAEALFVAGKRQELRGNPRAALTAYTKGSEADPRSSLLTLALGSLEMSLEEVNPNFIKRGIERMQKVVDASSAGSGAYVPAVPEDSLVGYGIAIRSAFWHSQYNYGKEAYRAAQAASRSAYPHDDCYSGLFHATYVPHIPMTREEAEANIQDFHQRIDKLMPRVGSLMCANVRTMTVPFPVAYYDLDFREELSKWTDLFMGVFRGNLALTAPDLRRDDEMLVHRPIKTVSPARPVRIGFISSFFRSYSSIWGSFGKTINHLQRQPNLAVELIYFPRTSITEEDKSLSLSPSTNVYLRPFGPLMDDPSRHMARKAIVERKYDILVYLDLFMTAELHDLAVAKLAPIQVVTHGHPVTSGIPREVMDYYISWGAAEVPDRKKAQSFYTEQLIMLPGDKVWEYFEPRTKDGYSLNEGSRFDHYTRGSLAREVLSGDPHGTGLVTDPSSRLYFCAQAAFKFHFVFDEMIAGIQRKDPDAVIVLVGLMGELAELHAKITKRMGDVTGVDMGRVVFVPRMKHHHLMAMYKLCDVVLDSAYFGGDTTSREAFETGAPVVTLPHKTIGQRWTQAYYTMMGIHDFIAAGPEEYVDIAVTTANWSEEAKEESRRRIREAAHERLFRKEGGVRDWANMFLDIATRPRRWRWADERDLRPVVGGGGGGSGGGNSARVEL